MPGDEIAERRGIVADLLGEFGAAVGEHFLERLQPRRQHVLDGVAAGVDGSRKRLGVLAEGIAHLVAADDDGVGDARAGLLELGDDVAAAQAEIEDERLARGPERVVHFLGTDRNDFGEPRRGVDDRIGKFARARSHHLDDRSRFFGETVGDAIEIAHHHLRQVGGEFREFLADMVGLEIQARGQPVAGLGDGIRRRGAGALEPLQHVAAAFVDRIDHGIADARERVGDVLALLGEGAGDALRGFVDLAGDDLADRVDVVVEIGCAPLSASRT